MYNKKGLMLLVGLSFLIHTTNATDLSLFKQSWVAKALKLQREIDINAPFNESTYIATHNSYNSKAYQKPLLRYLDPNQLLSIYDQLDSGIRSIELDAHWTLNSHFRKEILLCHGKPNHFGCGIYDKPITDALSELHTWLKDNPNEIVLLYIERHLDGHEPRLTALLTEYLGQYIFRPSDINAVKPARACMSIPSNLTKADVLRAGKQLLIVAKECMSKNVKYEEENLFKQDWNDYVFTGIGDIPLLPYTFLETTITHFTPYPDCSRTTIFKNDIYHSSLWRILEDRTKLSKIIHREKKLRVEDMRQLLRCGINWLAMDKLAINDKRLAAAVWSWTENYPIVGNNANCTQYEYNVGIKNVRCDIPQSGYTCQEETTHDIRAIEAFGTWDKGETFCQSIAGIKWHFAVPINALQIANLKEELFTKKLSSVWLNYSLLPDGKWQANLISNKYRRKETSHG